MHDTPWIVDCWALLSIDFSRQEYCCGLPFPPPGYLPDPGIKPICLVSPALQGDSLQLSHLGNSDWGYKGSEFYLGWYKVIVYDLYEITGTENKERV